MNKYLGFHGHRYGDIFMGLAAFEILKMHEPDCETTIIINGDYREAAPFFLAQKSVDKIYITDNPVGSFNEKDMEWIRAQKFTYIFNPSKDHDHSDPWWKHRNQPLELAYMHGLYINEHSGKLYLNKWFKSDPVFKNYIAFQPFAGSYDPNNKKALSVSFAQEIVNGIIKLGYDVLVLGGPNEPKLNNVVKLPTDYFVSGKNLLSCKALVVCDSGFNWMASCYDFPTLGLYSHEYYGEKYVKNIQPINPNAIYLNRSSVNEIPLDEIISNLLTLTK